MDSDAKILQDKSVRDEFLVQWDGHDENGDPCEDEWLRRSRCSKDLLKKNPNNPRNKARASSGVLHTSLCNPPLINYLLVMSSNALV